MTPAVRAIVDFFRLVKRENEVNQQILAFSISHNERNVRIYSHYAVIKGKDTEYYRYPIDDFSFYCDGQQGELDSIPICQESIQYMGTQSFQGDLLVVPGSGDSSPSEAPGLSQNVGNPTQPEQPAATPDTSVAMPDEAKRRKGE